MVAAILFARFARFLILRFGWHADSGALRLYNYWWYLFRGYKVDEGIKDSSALQFDIVYVDALVNTNEGAVIYSGYLIDFVSYGEKLDRIYLSDTVKREFRINQQNNRDNVPGNEIVTSWPIDGDTMVIPYANIINMNLHFVTLPEGLGDVEENAKIEISQEPDNRN